MASILIIDDSAYMRAKIREILESDGHETMEAGDGLSGLRLAGTRGPDCIILDLIMPEVDGLKVLKALRDEGSVVPVIVVSADIQVSVQKKCLELGAAALISKPPKKRDILNAVREVLSLKQGVAMPQPTPHHIDVLKELINIGVGRAAGALNEMVNCRVNLEVPSVRVLTPLQFKKETADLGDKKMAAVRIGFEGPFSGTAALVIPPESASKLVNVLTGETAVATDLDSAKEETLREVGNIVINSVMGSLGNILNQYISCSLPAYIENTVKNIFISEKIGNDTIFLLVRTHFLIEQHQIEGNIILLFTVGSFDVLLSAIDAMQ